jgi:hypothetical protein
MPTIDSPGKMPVIGLALMIVPGDSLLKLMRALFVVSAKMVSEHRPSAAVCATDGEIEN